MSFGIGLGDCILMLKQVLLAFQNLSGAAVAGFKQYKRKYSQLAATIAMVNSCVVDSRHLIDERFRYEAREIRRLLRSFRQGLDGLEDRLGNRRCRRSLLNAPAKVAWPVHEKKFAGVYSELMEQLDILQVKRLFLGNIYPEATRDSLLLKDKFYLEDAKGGSQSLDFAYVPTWEDLHIYLLHRFPKKDPLHNSILARRYIFHRESVDDDIISHDPGAQPLQSLVRPRQRLHMTVIFPWDDAYQEECPKCHKRRSAEFTGPILLCPGCNLVLRFRDSHEGEPDALTQLMMNHMEQNHGRDLLQHLIMVLSPGARWLGDVGPSLYLPALKDCIDAVEIGPRRPREQNQAPDLGLRDGQLAKISQVSRVTLCTTRWPDTVQQRRHAAAVQELSRTMNGLERMVEFIDGEDLPIGMVASVLNSRFWNGRAGAGEKKFLKSVLKGHERRRRSALVCSPDTMEYLRRQCACMSDAEAEFLLPSLLVRSLCWMYGELLDAETQILRACTRLLHYWALPEGIRRQPSHWALKAFCTPHAVLLMPVWRLTFDAAEDFMELFAKEKPLYLARVVLLLVQRSEAITLNYYFKGSLDRLFARLAVMQGGRPMRNDNARCKRWLEMAMSAGGLGEALPLIAAELRGLVHGGYL